MGLFVLIIKVMQMFYYFIYYIYEVKHLCGLWNYEGFSLYITDCRKQCRLLPLYFPRDTHEEEVAILKLPADVGDENGETIIDERKIRIKPLPNVKKNVSRTPAPMDLPVSDVGLVRRYVALQTHNVF